MAFASFVSNRFVLLHVNLVHVRQFFLIIGLKWTGRSLNAWVFFPMTLFVQMVSSCHAIVKMECELMYISSFHIYVFKMILADQEQIFKFVLRFAP